MSVLLNVYGAHTQNTHTHTRARTHLLTPTYVLMSPYVYLAWNPRSSAPNKYFHTQG